MTWLAGWGFRKILYITGSTAGAVTDYQLKLNVHKSAGTDTITDVYLETNVRDDFGDIRFTESDGTTILDYWIESYISGTSAIIWIKVSAIPASPNTTTIYIYYNNPSETTTSSGTNTFMFFDDFTVDSSANYTIFNVNTGNNATKTWDAGGFLKIASINPTWHKVLYNAGSFDKNISISAKIRIDNYGEDTNHNGKDCCVIVRTTLDGAYPGTGNAGGFDSRPVSSPQIRIKWSVDGTDTIVAQAYTTGVWYLLSLTAYETELRFYLDNVLKISSTYPTVPATGYIGLIIYEADVSLDDLRIRKFVSPEPQFASIGTTTTLGKILSKINRGISILGGISVGKGKSRR